MVADAEGKEVYLYGGQVGTVGLRDVWTTDTASGIWQNTIPQVGPGIQEIGVSQAHVPWEDRWLVQAGPTGRMYERNEAGYRDLGPGPTNNAGYSLWVELLVDTNQRKIYGYYTQGGMLFEWTGTGWTLVPAASHGLPTTPQFSNYDPATGSFYYIGGGGTNGGGLYRWNGGLPVRLGPMPIIPPRLPGLPPGRLVFDSDRGQIALVYWIPGGIGIAEWDGQTWNLTTAPLGSFAADRGWDAAWVKGRGIVLVTIYPNTVWSWNGTGSWSRLNAPTSMTSQAIQGMCFDRARNRLRINTLDNLLVYDTYWDLFEEQLRVDDPTPPPGNTIHFTVDSQANQGQPWMLLLSHETQPAIPLAGVAQDPDRVLPLAFDDLLASSLGTGLRGVLDAQGLGSATLTIPGDPALGGFAFHAAAVTITPQAQIGLVSNPVQVLVTR